MLQEHHSRDSLIFCFGFEKAESILGCQNPTREFGVEGSTRSNRSTAAPTGSCLQRWNHDGLEPTTEWEDLAVLQIASQKANTDRLFFSHIQQALGQARPDFHGERRPLASGPSGGHSQDDLPAGDRKRFDPFITNLPRSSIASRVLSWSPPSYCQGRTLTRQNLLLQCVFVELSRSDDNRGESATHGSIFVED